MGRWRGLRRPERFGIGVDNRLSHGSRNCQQDFLTGS
jgi:hypothetical protein